MRRANNDSAKWEDYASKVLAQPDGSSPWLTGSRSIYVSDDREHLDFLHVETDMLSLFAASVISRASVSRQAVSGVKLGSYNEPFRRCLTGLTSRSGK